MKIYVKDVNIESLSIRDYPVLMINKHNGQAVLFFNSTVGIDSSGCYSANYIPCSDDTNWYKAPSGSTFDVTFMMS